MLRHKGLRNIKGNNFCYCPIFSEPGIFQGLHQITILPWCNVSKIMVSEKNATPGHSSQSIKLLSNFLYRKQKEIDLENVHQYMINTPRGKLKIHFSMFHLKMRIYYNNYFKLPV